MDKLTGQPHFKGTQLTIGEHEQAESYDARFLISALMVYVAKGDGSISNEESAKMRILLNRHRLANR